jgi:hypothetical protein
MENASFDRFSASPHCQDRPATLGRILDYSGLAAIFMVLEVAGLLYLQHFAGKSPSNASRHPTSVYCYEMGPASGGIHPQDLPLTSPPPVGRCGKNWCLN